MAVAIKRAIREELGLVASGGVSYNKFIAKLASDQNKPDGITILGDDEIAARIWPLPAKKINGIGPKATAALASRPTAV